MCRASMPHGYGMAADGGVRISAVVAPHAVRDRAARRRPLLARPQDRQGTLASARPRHRSQLPTATACPLGMNGPTGNCAPAARGIIIGTMREKLLPGHSKEALIMPELSASDQPRADFSRFHRLRIYPVHAYRQLHCQSGGRESRGHGRGILTPTIIAYLVVTIDLFGGILILVGYQTRWASIVLIVFVVLTLHIRAQFLDHGRPGARGQSR